MPLFVVGVVFPLFLCAQIKGAPPPVPTDPGSPRSRSSFPELEVTARARVLTVASGSVRIGNRTYHLPGASVSIVSGARDASGSCYVYASDLGTLVIECPAKAELTFTSCSNCITAVVQQPSVPSGAVPLAEVDLLPGEPPSWGAVRDQRAVLSNSSIQAGTGVAISTNGSVAMLGVDTATIPTLGGLNAFTGAVRMHASTQTAPHRLAASDPERCDPDLRETYRNTKTNRVRVCIGANQWGDEPSPRIVASEEAWFPAGGASSTMGGWLAGPATVRPLAAGGLQWPAIAIDAGQSATLHYRLPSSWEPGISAELVFTLTRPAEIRWTFSAACRGFGDDLGKPPFGSGQTVSSTPLRPLAMTAAAVPELDASGCKPGDILLVRVSREAGATDPASILGMRLTTKKVLGAN